MDDFVRDQVETETHVFVVFHWSHEVEVGEIHAIETCMWSRDGRVDEELSSDKIGSGSALVTFVGDTVASHGKACAMWFIFLWSVVANNATVCGVLVTRHLLPVNEKTSVGALNVTYSLEETTEFVYEACLPC